MELLLHKYTHKDHEYLICDCTKNNYAIGKEEIRVMCSANFGINITSILLGPVMKNGELSLYSYNADGTQNTVDEREKQVFTQYLYDTGYLSNIEPTGVTKISKILLCEHFLEENDFRLSDQNDQDNYQQAV